MKKFCSFAVTCHVKLYLRIFISQSVNKSSRRRSHLDMGRQLQFGVESRHGQAFGPTVNPLQGQIRIGNNPWRRLTSSVHCPARNVKYKTRVQMSSSDRRSTL